MALTCQLVDSISATPTIRLNLNSAPWVTLAATNFGFPEMRRTASSSFLTDGDHIGASVYGNRILNLQLQVRTASVDDTATQLQKLIRELDRPTNLLCTRLGTQPVFFRTFRSTPDAWQIITTGTVMSLTIPLVAEPFAIGLEESLGSFTVNNDPAAGSNPLYFDVAAASIKGDVPAPLYMKTTSSLAGHQVLIATRRRGTPANGTYFIQAENGTNGTDTADQADANASGGNEVRTTFATVTAFADRVTATLPSATADPELRGTYRVFIRHQRSATGSVINTKITFANGTPGNPQFTLTDSTTYQLIDYGLLQIPFGSNANQDGYGSELAAVGVPVTIRTQRVSGTASLDTDYILLLPADTEFAWISWPTLPAGPEWVFDGPNDDVYWRSTTGTNHVVSATGGEFPTYVGGLPMITPNQISRVFFVVATGAITVSTVLTASYNPRYLTVRPAAT